MYDKVVVTLDGSQLAEAVLPWASELVCTAATKEVVLLTVLENAKEQPRRLAEGYLRDQAIQLEAACCKRGSTAPAVSGCTVVSDARQVATTILRFAEENSIDLIMISTHGRSGIDRWMMGSVAEKVLRGTDIPLLLVCATEDCQARTTSLKHILVPLDGSDLAEQALPYAERLAKCASGQVTLLYVEPVPGGDTGEGGRRTTIALHTHREQDMSTHLDCIATELRGTDTEVKTKTVVGDPSKQIVQEAEQGVANLIVMSAHGRTGLNRWAFGSVADRVLRSSPIPVLLVPAAVRGVVPQHLQGPLVYCCHNCGRRTYLETFTPKDRCLRCHHLLRTCGNCVHFDGIRCILQLPHEAIHASNRCPQFQFRKTRLVLR